MVTVTAPRGPSATGFAAMFAAVLIAFASPDARADDAFTRARSSHAFAATEGSSSGDAGGGDTSTGGGSTGGAGSDTGDFGTSTTPGTDGGSASTGDTGEPPVTNDSGPGLSSGGRTTSSPSDGPDDGCTIAPHPRTAPTLLGLAMLLLVSRRRRNTR